MGFEDRPYYRDKSGSAGNPLLWLVSGSLPLFTAFGIRVRAHAIMVLYIAWEILFPGEGDIPIRERSIAMGILFGIVLLHEFGHCFSARWVGGEADEILMHPLGGLAFAHPPRRPWPTFLTVAGGPAVNIILCAICAVILYASFGYVPWTPLRLHSISEYRNFAQWGMYPLLVYQLSWQIFAFNVFVPVFPLDGGQMLQTALWKWIGYYRSMVVSTTIGIAGGAIAGLLGIMWGSPLLATAGILGLLWCFQMRRQIIAQGPGVDWELENDEYAYSASLRPEGRKHVTKRSIKRAQRVARQEAVEQKRIDAILAKVSAQGMHSLNWMEKRTLHKATERQRRGR